MKKKRFTAKITVAVTPGQHKALERLAEARQLSVADIGREAVRFYLAAPSAQSKKAEVAA